MLVKVVASWVAIAVALAVTAWAIDDVTVDGGTVGLLWVAVVFGLVNAIIGPILRLLSLPLTLVTFGLFSLAVNGLLLAMTAGLSDYLEVGGFISTVLAAFLISLLSVLLHALVPDVRG